MITDALTYIVVAVAVGLTYVIVRMASDKA